MAVHAAPILKKAVLTTAAARDEYQTAFEEINADDPV